MPHDIILLRHEALEFELMRKGISYKEAHTEVEKVYDYAAALSAFEERVGGVVVYLELVAIDGDEVIYDYMPEREDAPRGTVSVNRETRKRTLRKRSEAGSWSAYHGQAWRRIDQMLDAGKLEKKTFSAWY